MVRIVLVILDLFVLSGCNSEPKCGCIDTEENCGYWTCFTSKWNVCEYTCMKCTRGDGDDGRSGRLDEALPKVECENGWAKIVEQDPLFPKQFSGVMKEIPAGKKLFIYTVGGNGNGRFIIQRPGEGPDVPLFLTIRWSSEMRISSKKDGQWCETSIFNRLPSIYGDPFVMQVVRWGSSQVYDFSLLGNDASYRFYPKANIQVGDYYTLIQEGGAFYGISWTVRSDFVKFSSALPTDGRIVIQGKMSILYDERSSIIMRRSDRSVIYKIEAFVDNQIRISKFDKGDELEAMKECTLPFVDTKYGKRETIERTFVIKKTSVGINFYYDNKLSCEFTDDGEESDGIWRVLADQFYAVREIASNNC